MAYSKQNFTDGKVLMASHLNHIEDGIANMWDVIYPVGSIYISSSATSPASLFGGTWEQITDRVIVGAGGKYDVNSTGGAATHTLTVDEMPPHNHVVYMGRGNYDVQGIWGSSACEPLTNPSGSVTDIQGGGAAHNNMQPYIAKYIWERVE